MQVVTGAAKSAVELTDAASAFLPSFAPLFFALVMDSPTAGAEMYGKGQPVKHVVELLDEAYQA